MIVNTVSSATLIGLRLRICPTKWISKNLTFEDWVKIIWTGHNQFELLPVKILLPYQASCLWWLFSNVFVSFNKREIEDTDNALQQAREVDERYTPVNMRTLLLAYQTSAALKHHARAVKVLKLWSVIIVCLSRVYACIGKT